VKSSISRTSTTFYNGKYLKKITTSSGQTTVEFIPAAEDRADVFTTDYSHDPYHILSNNHALGKSI